MDDIPTLKDLQYLKKHSKRIINSLVSKVKVLQKREVSKLDITKLQQLKESFDEVINELQGTEETMEKYYEEELDMDEEYRIYDELLSKALDQLDITADMIARNQFQSIAREACCNLSALEDSMAVESKATYSDDMAAIAANLEKLSVYSCRFTDLERRINPFILVFFKLKAEAEIREDSKAVAHKSLFIDDSSSSTSVSRTDNIKLPNSSCQLSMVSI